MTVKQYLHIKCMERHTTFQHVAIRAGVHPNTMARWMEEPWKMRSGDAFAVAKVLELNTLEWVTLQEKITGEIEAHTGYRLEEADEHHDIEAAATC